MHVYAHIDTCMHMCGGILTRVQTLDEGRRVDEVAPAERADDVLVQVLDEGLSSLLIGRLPPLLRQLHLGSLRLASYTPWKTSFYPALLYCARSKAAAAAARACASPERAQQSRYRDPPAHFFLSMACDTFARPFYRAVFFFFFFFFFFF